MCTHSRFSSLISATKTQTRRLLLVAVLFLAIPCSAQDGGSSDVGDGGDPIRQHFIQVGEESLIWAKHSPGVLRRLEGGEKMLPILSIFLDIRFLSVSNSDLIDNGGSIVHSLGKPSKLVLNHDYWYKKIRDKIDLHIEVFHELLRAAGIDDDNYAISKHLKHPIYRPRLGDNFHYFDVSEDLFKNARTIAKENFIVSSAFYPESRIKRNDFTYALISKINTHFKDKRRLLFLQNGVKTFTELEPGKNYCLWEHSDLSPDLWKDERFFVSQSDRWTFKEIIPGDRTFLGMQFKLLGENGHFSHLYCRDRSTTVQELKELLTSSFSLVTLENMEEGIIRPPNALINTATDFYRLRGEYQIELQKQNDAQQSRIAKELSQIIDHPGMAGTIAATAVSALSTYAIQRQLKNHILSKLAEKISVQKSALAIHTTTLEKLALENQRIDTFLQKNYSSLTKDKIRAALKQSHAIQMKSLKSLNTVESLMANYARLEFYQLNFQYKLSKLSLVAKKRFYPAKEITDIFLTPDVKKLKFTVGAATWGIKTLKSLTKGLVVGLAIELAVAPFTFSRVEPTLAWANLLVEHPELLLAPQMMRELGIIQSHESVWLTMAATYRYHPEKVRLAQQKLLKIQDKEFEKEFAQLVFSQ